LVEPIAVGEFSVLPVDTQIYLSDDSLQPP
jgi:hypothetical protein